VPLTEKDGSEGGEGGGAEAWVMELTAGVKESKARPISFTGSLLYQTRCLVLACRNYMTIDILRRVLEDYFGYDVTFVMNITDVDDKIVLRARRNHLLKKYQEEAADIVQVRCKLEEGGGGQVWRIVDDWPGNYKSATAMHRVGLASL